MVNPREKWPELAEVADYLREKYGPDAIQRMWVEDEDGAVLAGRRPDSEMYAVYVDADAVVKSDAARAERRAMDEARRLSNKAKKR